MRIVITQNTTLDGRVEMLDDWFDPSNQDEDLAAELMRQTEREDVLLLGRQTFEDFRGYWPLQTGDTTGVAESLDRADKRVISSTLTDPGWQNTTVISGDPQEAVLELRAAPGRDVIITGSIQLCHALIRAGLVDLYRMFTYPAWQGRGRGFFPDGYSVPQLRRTETKAFASGVIYAAFEPLAGLGSEQED
ncbi:dihydrofolate reductase family protein [Citricoccus alkalitolerans]|uniref:Dihydrofolate reductase family protein n=1 Tax=Citricoccus alkalitolerans TaxID=246603 RepID=A0ABV8XWP3_9MICC